MTEYRSSWVSGTNVKRVDLRHSIQILVHPISTILLFSCILESESTWSSSSVYLDDIWTIFGGSRRESDRVPHITKNGAPRWITTIRENLFSTNEYPLCPVCLKYANSRLERCALWISYLIVDNLLITFDFIVCLSISP